MATVAGPGSSNPLVGGLRRSGLVSLMVLHHLASEPQCGNQLIERIGNLTAGALTINPNTMYPLLRSLESRGLVVGEWAHPERRSRRMYRITSAGRAERRRLIRQLEPNLNAIATTIDVLRSELLAR
jgi:PadR family transcriptional regulator, regulatory protein PadR